MQKPRLLDLFCGAGGCAVGYSRAGFEVAGVDINPQPHYPFEFHQANAMEYSLRGFDIIHASPPCQRYSSATANKNKHPDLYAAIRQRLIDNGKPWVIENVIGAPYLSGIILCGSMFGLESEGEWLQRHRNFETSLLIMQPKCSHRTDKRAVTVTDKSFLKQTREYHHSRQTTFENAKRLMGIYWMDRYELPLAIPPAYTEWIGKVIIAASMPQEVGQKDNIESAPCVKCLYDEMLYGK